MLENDLILKFFFVEGFVGAVHHNHASGKINRSKYIKTMLDDYLLESDGVDSKPVYLTDALVLCGMKDDDNIKVVVTVLGMVSTAFGSESDKIYGRCF